MKLYKLISMSLVTLTALAVTTMAAIAGGNKLPSVVPAFCDFGEGQQSFFVGNVLNLRTNPFGFSDDSTGFNLFNQFAPGRVFPSGTVSFNLQRPNGTPANNNTNVEVALLYPDGSALFDNFLPDANGNVSFTTVSNNGFLHDEIQVAVNSSNGNQRRFLVTNIRMLGALLLLDHTNVADQALGCDDD